MQTTVNDTSILWTSSDSAKNYHATCDQVTPKCLTSYTLKAQIFQYLERITKFKEHGSFKLRELQEEQLH
jgi:hypothetical protein